MQNRNVPYKSQWDADAGKTKNDCGPASAAMIMNYYDPNLKLTTDQVFDKTGAGQGYIGFSQLTNAIKAFGFETVVEYNISIERLKQLIDADTPPIALVHYGDLGSRQDKAFTGPHFFAVVGYREDGYFVNDPNFWGNFRQDGDHHFYPKAEFEKSFSNAHLYGGNPDRSVIWIKRKQPTAADYEKLFNGARLTRDSYWNFMIAVCNIFNIKLDPNNINDALKQIQACVDSLKKEKNPVEGNSAILSDIHKAVEILNKY